MTDSIHVIKEGVGLFWRLMRSMHVRKMFAESRDSPREKLVAGIKRASEYP